MSGFVFGEVDVPDVTVLLGKSFPANTDDTFFSNVLRTDNTAVEMVEAPGSGRALVITGYSWTNGSTTVDTKVSLYKSSADADATTTPILRLHAFAIGGVAQQCAIVVPENSPIYVRCGSGSFDVEVNVYGWTVTL